MTFEKEGNIESLGYGDHIAFLFSRHDEYRYITTRYIEDGLQKNDKVVFVIDEYPVKLLVKELKKIGVNVEYFTSKGQLVFLSVKDIYIGENGFIYEDTINNWRYQAALFEKDKYNGLRIAGDVLFATYIEENVYEKLMDYEVHVHSELFKESSSQMHLCIYNKQKFPPNVLEDIIKKHNVIIYGEEVIKPNPFYVGFDIMLKEYNKSKAIRRFFSIDSNEYDNMVQHENVKNDKVESILKHVLRFTGDGAWEWDLATNKIELYGNIQEIFICNNNATIVDYNEFIKLIHPDDFNDFCKDIDKILESQTLYINKEFRLRSRNNEWEWYLIKGLPIKRNELNGKILKLVGVFNNTTEINRVKRELKEKIHYEELRSDFFANLSHELRTPLNVILGTLQLQELYLNKFDSKETVAKYKKQLKTLKSNSYRLLRLVNNLIDITKIDAGFYKLNFDNYNIASIIKNIVLSLEDYINKHGLTLEFNCNFNDEHIACDPDSMERVIMNLMSNAIKFTNSGGKITVNLSKDKEYVYISVKDSGIGMPKEKLSNIFDRFVQVDNNLVRSREGSGIGLSLVKSIVEMHDGSISVQSELDKGSEFTISLPRRLVNKDSLCTNEVTQSWSSNAERLNIEFADIYADF